MKKHHAVISAIVFQLSISGISTTYAEEPNWKWIVVDPPTTLPTLIAKGGVLETIFLLVAEVIIFPILAQIMILRSERSS